MASSTEQALTPVIEKVMTLHPKTILDVGVGFGKWGFLCREYLECWKDRTYPKDWQIQLDGIEAWEPFVSGLPWLKVVYDNIYIGDAEVLIHGLDDYDLIIANDIIEHLEKTKSESLLTQILSKSSVAIVNVPIGKAWLGNRKVDDNPYNLHKCVWEKEELLEIGELCNKKTEIQIWNGVRGEGALMFYED